jgi:hypothetical protein
MIRIRTLLAACLALATVAVAPAAASAAPTVGFNDHFGIGNMERSVAQAQQFGVTSNRIFVRWDWMETGRGSKDFSLTDPQYKALRAAGQRPFWVINGAPAWALPADCQSVTQCPPSDEAAYRNFLNAFAARYPESAGYEIGNEPNLNHSWLTPDPIKYAEMLRTAYGAIKFATPNVPVMIGGITPGAVSGNGIDATAFLDALYKLGVKDFSDGIGYHVYPGGPVNEVAPDIKKAMAQAIAVRDRYGDDAGFYITETGFPSLGKSEYSDAIFDEASQAERLAISYRVYKSIPAVKAIYYFRLTDNTDGSYLEQATGLFRADGSPKPAVQALKDAIADPVAWPDYSISVAAPKKAVSGARFKVTAAGYTGHGAVKYEWLLKRPAGHWSLPFATTSRPAVGVKYGKPAKYTIGVRVVTDRDSFTVAEGATVKVTPKPAKADKKKAAKKKKAKKKKKKSKKKGKGKK